jgi:hypothetical protein
MKLIDYIIDRTSEASTWRGLIMLVAGVSGLSISSELATHIITVGMALSGLLGALTPDNTTSAP